jgi:hypothetical protein
VVGVNAGWLTTDSESSRSVSPEQKLVRAVLEQAVNDARRGSAAALAWLECETSDADTGWTFLQVCEHLDADPSWVRRIAAEYIAAHPYVRRRRRARTATQHPEAA